MTPIPDPQFNTSGSSNEAPRLLDPRDKTAGLDVRTPVVPASYEMAKQPPQRTYTPPTASIPSNDQGWVSLNK